ncbi:hypothetical protein D3C80_598300 [compost metagenome]
MSEQNPPKKHHYIPAFYTKRWAGADNKVMVFSKPYNEVTDRRRHPDATGFQLNLYGLRGSDKGEEIEGSFFKPVDNYAHEALERLESNQNLAEWPREIRSNWTRFIISLLFRCPADLEILRERWSQDFTKTDDELEEKYAAIRKDGYPETLSKFLSEMPKLSVEQSMFSIYQSMIDNENVGRFINSMQWCVIDTSSSNLQLFTSDCPVFRTNGLNHPNSHLAMPIGPHRLFLAANSREVIQRALKTSPRVLVMNTNRAVVRSARLYVFAKSASVSEYNFVSKQFGIAPQKRLLEDMFDKRKFVPSKQTLEGQHRR